MSRKQVNEVVEGRQAEFEAWLADDKVNPNPQKPGGVKCYLSYVNCCSKIMKQIQVREGLLHGSVYDYDDVDSFNRDKAILIESAEFPATLDKNSNEENKKVKKIRTNYKSGLNRYSKFLEWRIAASCVVTNSVQDSDDSSNIKPEVRDDITCCKVSTVPQKQAECVSVAESDERSEFKENKGTGMKTKTVLDCTKPLVDAVVDWLIEQGRDTRLGVKSFEHLMVFVPTQQAGRALRLALAQKCGSGCIPPIVQMPMTYLNNGCKAVDQDKEEATEAQLYDLLTDVILDSDFSTCSALGKKPKEKQLEWAMSRAAQLFEIWHILSQNGLKMSDVSNQVTEYDFEWFPSQEASRWAELAKLEEAFEAELSQNQLSYSLLDLSSAETVAKIPAPVGVERIVLPALVDAPPVFFNWLKTVKLPDNGGIDVLIHCEKQHKSKFDEWGRPETKFWAEEFDGIQISKAAIDFRKNATESAREIVSDVVASTQSNSQVEVGLLDPTMFDDLKVALQARSDKGTISLSNPATTSFVCSPLGRVVQQVVAMLKIPQAADIPYENISVFIRNHDVINWLSDTPKGQSSILSAFDFVQNNHIPQTLGSLVPTCGNMIKKLEARDKYNQKPDYVLVRDISEMLLKVFSGKDGSDKFLTVAQICKAIYSNRTTTNKDFITALSTLGTTLNQVTQAQKADDCSEKKLAIFEKLVSELEYQLDEPNEDAIKTKGWLELQWANPGILLMAGFLEGVVPDAVKGHAFLPNRLREQLGLVSNAQRTARDAYILNEILQSHKQNEIKIFVHRVDRKGDVCKPSRLLFMCDDSSLATLAQKLYTDDMPSAGTPARELPNNWRLNLPKLSDGEIAIKSPCEPKMKSLSASKVETYLDCPFTYYLQEILKMKKQDDSLIEIPATDYGTLCHAVLENFGNDGTIKNSEVEADIEKWLSFDLDKEARKRYGDEDVRSPFVKLQIESTRARLRGFAKWQALQPKAHWKIVATELYVESIFRDGEFKECKAWTDKPKKPVEKQKLAEGSCNGDEDKRVNEKCTDSAGVKFTGYVDRVDYNAHTNTYRIIDYKTWTKKDDDKNSSMSSKDADINRMKNLGFPVFREEQQQENEIEAKGKGNGKEAKEKKQTKAKLFVLKKLQLPIYQAIFSEIEAKDDKDLPKCDAVRPWFKSPEAKAVEARYCVLPADCSVDLVPKEPDPKSDPPKTMVYVDSTNEKIDLHVAAMKTLKVVIDKMKAQIYWPPKDADEGQWDLKPLFIPKKTGAIAESICAGWMDDQTKRINEFVLTATSASNSESTQEEGKSND